MLSKKFIRLNIINISIIVFVMLFSAVHTLKPAVIYDMDGTFRPFGVGYRHKTVVPAWLIAIFLAIFSYLFVLYIYINMR